MNRRSLLQSVLAIPALLVGKVVGSTNKPKPTSSNPVEVETACCLRPDERVIGMTTFQDRLIVATENGVYFLSRDGDVIGLRRIGDR